MRWSRNAPLLPVASGAGSNVATTSDRLILRLFYLFYTVISRKLKINTILFSAKIKRRHLAIIDGQYCPGSPGPLPGKPD